MAAPIALEVSCPVAFCHRTPGRPCKDKEGHRRVTPHDERYHFAYQEIPARRAAREREASERALAEAETAAWVAEVEPLMPAAERLLLQQEDIYRGGERR